MFGALHYPLFPEIFVLALSATLLKQNFMSYIEKKVVSVRIKTKKF